MISVCVGESKIASYLELKKDDLFYKLQILGLNLARNVSQSSVRIRPETQARPDLQLCTLAASRCFVLG